MKEKHDKPNHSEPKPAAYQKPQLTRWGTLRELTEGGGGVTKEPTTRRKTRF
jgi:hypothetical protein